MTTEANKSKYDEIKVKHPDAIIIFRNDTDSMYEIFGEDAYIAMQIIENIVLDPKKVIVSSYRFATRELDVNLPKLIRAGKRVAFYEK